MYCNDTEAMISFKRGFAHYRNVVCPQYQTLNRLEFEALDFDLIDRLGKMDHKLCLAKYMIDGDIVSLFKSLNKLYKYGTFAVFAVDALDNPNSNPDSERCVSALTWLCSDKLNGKMEAPQMMARLRGIWDKELYEDMSMIDFDS
eukprot:175920_1